MKWYTGRQNNSGGFFVEDEKVGVFVSVQAGTPETATAKFSEVTAESGEDWCECCGERWYESFSAEDGYDSPHYYAEPLVKAKGYFSGNSHVLHYADGRVEQKVTGSEDE